MQRGPRQTHAGWRETQGLQAGNKGTGCSGRAASPPCSPAPHHALPIYRVPPRPCCALPLGSEGKGRVQESGKTRRGHILNTIPALQDLTLAAGSFVAEPEAQGRLFITAPPNQPQVGLEMYNPNAGGCSANTSHWTQGGGSLGCARPQHTESGHASHCQHLPSNSPHSAGRGWACWGGDEKLSGKKQERREKGE